MNEIYIQKYRNNAWLRSLVLYEIGVEATLGLHQIIEDFNQSIRHSKSRSGIFLLPFTDVNLAQTRLLSRFFNSKS